ncbi:MAG: PEP-CTERM sorting domain-containing protein, partial [Lacipirellulaceae bacterium]
SVINIVPPFASFSWPTDTIWMHPPSVGFAVVTWTSPVTGTADIEFEFDDMDPNGPTSATGIRWFVDVGDVSGTLANGSFVNGAGIAPITISNVSINAGDQIHFIVDPLNDFGFDSTTFRATISYVPEPGSVVLLMLGASYGVVRRR